MYVFSFYMIETGSNSSHSSHSSTDRVDNSPVVPEPSPQMKLYKFDQDSVPANDFTTATETHAKVRNLALFL